MRAWEFVLSGTSQPYLCQLRLNQITDLARRAAREHFRHHPGYRFANYHAFIRSLEEKCGAEHKEWRPHG